jgi:excisionase family DNA binding protein
MENVTDKAEPRNRHERRRRAAGHVPSAYTINGFADAYGIGRSKIYELIRLSNLRAVKCGSRTLIPADAADEWLRNLPTFHEAAKEA